MVTPIIVLILLSTPLSFAFLYSKVVGKPVSIRKYACWGLGIAFIYFFVGHIVKTHEMVEMLPPWVPFRLALIYVTGFLEIIIGVALFIPRYQQNASKLAIAVLVLFFPANIYAALNGVGMGGHQWGPVYLAIRGPLQIVLIAWAYFLCLECHNKSIQPNAHASAD